MSEQSKLDYEWMWKRLKYQIELCESKDLREIPLFVVRAFMDFIEDIARHREEKHGS